LSLCLAAAGLAVQIATVEFTLSWTHTVERTVWEEDWRIADDRLVLVQARVKGSGAGMEPPPGARLVGGFYVWSPQTPLLRELVLRRAEQAGDWSLCAAGRCAALAEWIGGEGDPVRISGCIE
jgi:hypothetical protein